MLAVDILKYGLMFLGLVLVFFIYVYFDNLSRQVNFWYYAFKPIVHYSYLYLLQKYKWIKEDDYSKRLEAAHYSYAQTMHDACCNLKGFFVKIAQVMHSRPDICVEPFKTICAEFLSGCPSEPYHVIEKILKDELRVPLEEIFESIDEKPLGAASVAQAHLAVLKTGERVVIKVQYPWARSLFEVDLSNMLLVTYWLNTTAYNEINGAKAMYINELDFAEEMRSLEFFWQAHEDAPEHIRVRLPKPMSHLCSKRVIVMTYLEGKPLSSFLEAHTKQLGAVAGKDIDLSDVDFDQFQPPDEMQLKVLKSLFSIRNKVWNSMARSVNVSFGNLFRGLGRKSSTLVPYQSELPVAAEQLLHQLIDAIGYQMLILGKFTTDPHAGNILVDKNGSVGLIDFGQTWEAPLEDRKKFARLLLAAKRRDKEECVQRYLDMGFKSKNGDMDILFLLAVVMFDQIDYRLAQEVLQTKNRSEMIEKFLERDDLTNFPPQFHPFVRSTAIIRGLGFHLLCSPSLAQCWEGYCHEILGMKKPKKRRSKSLSENITKIALKFCPLIFPKKELRSMLS